MLSKLLLSNHPHTPICGGEVIFSYNLVSTPFSLGSTYFLNPASYAQVSATLHTGLCIPLFIGVADAVEQLEKGGNDLHFHLKLHK